MVGFSLTLVNFLEIYRTEPWQTKRMERVDEYNIRVLTSQKMNYQKYKL